MQLIEPDVRYKDSFIEAVREFKADTEFPKQKGWYHELSVPGLEVDFESFVKEQIAQARGEDLPAGFVPQSNYWLIDDGEFIGGVRIRHELTEHLKKIGGHIGYAIRPIKRRRGYGKKILEFALKKAKELGLTRVLLTCDVTNVASGKIIEENGGILENRISNPDTKVDKSRYWIDNR